MQHTLPNYIKLAVSAAGGRKKVAAMFGVSTWTVTYWGTEGLMPAEKITRLCDSGGVITPAQILKQIERTMADRRTAAQAEKAAA